MLVQSNWSDSQLVGFLPARRAQSICLHQQTSTVVDCSVPQGSLMISLMFTLNITSLVDCLKRTPSTITCMLTILNYSFQMIVPLLITFSNYLLLFLVMFGLV